MLPNGATVSISHIENLTLNSSVTLTNVLCVPTFSYNLLYISKLLQNTPYQVTFLDTKCYLQDHTWKKAFVLGKEEPILYMLTDIIPKNASSVLFSSQPMDHFVASTIGMDMWHARMGHKPAALINKLSISCKSKVLDVCGSCCLAKQHTLPFLDITHISENLFDLVHVDL